jgi:hypothetical protein
MYAHWIDDTVFFTNFNTLAACAEGTFDDIMKTLWEVDDHNVN